MEVTRANFSFVVKLEQASGNIEDLEDCLDQGWAALPNSDYGNLFNPTTNALTR